MKHSKLIMSMVCLLLAGVAIAQSEDEKNEIAFTQVERYPVYAGCEEVENINLQECFNKKVLERITRNFKFPQSAKKAGVEGEIVVSFIIEKNSKISNVTLFKGVANNYSDEPEKQKAARDLEKAALKAISDLKIVEPATKAGKPVRMKYTVPIQARLKS